MFDISGVFLMDDAALEFHGVGQLAALNGKELRKDDEFLDRLDPGEAFVDFVDSMRHIFSENGAVGRL